MCSRLVVASLVTPASASRLVATDWTRAASSSGSSATAGGGALSDSSIESGKPARLPGV